MPPPVFLLCLLLEPVLDFLKEVFAVALKLGLAYARNFKEFAVVFWPAAAHIGEGSVGKDHISRDILLCGESAAQIAQPVEKPWIF